MAQEIELKLAFPPAAHKSLLQHPLIAGAANAERTQTLINTYFDTPGLDLRRARIAVRTRKAGARWLQTVKCASSSEGGLSSRPEWEQPYRNERFDFSAIDHAETRQFLERNADRILPVFTTEFRRETRVVEPEPGVRILLMIDSGRISANDRESPISELELELACGNPVHLLDFALRLAADLPLLPEDASKAERGYRLFHGKTLKPASTPRSSVRREYTPLQAFKRLAYDALGAWQANANGILVSDDPEFVHQLRVALRRLRTLLRFFAPILPADFVNSGTYLLDELARQTGMARDLDVMRERILAPLTEIDGKFCMDILQRAEAARIEAGQTIHAMLTRAGCGVPLLAFTRALHVLEEPSAPETLSVFARVTLDRQRAHVRKCFAKAATLGTDKALHKLRIALKRLRYGLEFFLPLFQSKSLKIYLRTLATVQNHLGYLHDLAAAQAMLDTWAQNDSSIVESRAFVAGWHAPQAAKVRRRVLTQVESLLQDKAPWKT